MSRSSPGCQDFSSDTNKGQKGKEGKEPNSGKGRKPDYAAPANSAGHSKGGKEKEKDIDQSYSRHKANFYGQAPSEVPSGPPTDSQYPWRPAAKKAATAPVTSIDKEKLKAERWKYRAGASSSRSQEWYQTPVTPSGPPLSSSSSSSGLKRPARQQMPSTDEDEVVVVESIDELWKSELGVSKEDIQKLNDSRAKRARTPSRSAN